MVEIKTGTRTLHIGKSLVGKEDIQGKHCFVIGRYPYGDHHKHGFCYEVMFPDGYKTVAWEEDLQVVELYDNKAQVDNELLDEIVRLTQMNEYLLRKVNQSNGRDNQQDRQNSTEPGSGVGKSSSASQDIISNVGGVGELEEQTEKVEDRRLNFIRSIFTRQGKGF
jgi:hypothetical protein